MSNRGELGNAFDEFELLKWTKRLEFHQSILTWHIATDLCYYAVNIDESSNHKEVSKNLSDYMFYLLVKCRHMLPVGTGFVRFRDTYDQIIELFQQRDQDSVPKVREACQMLLQDNTEIWPTGVTESESKSVLFDACKLAKCLLEMQRGQMWDLLAQMWIEILGYAAIHCRVDNHAQQLRKGGEFLSHVWLLQAHLGLLPQFHVTKEELETTDTQPMVNAVNRTNTQPSENVTEIE